METTNLSAAANAPSERLSKRSEAPLVSAPVEFRRRAAGGEKC